MKTWKVKARVRKVYESLEELQSFDAVYNVAARCGYKSAEAMWKHNPTIGGSVNPADFGRVKGRA